MDQQEKKICQTCNKEKVIEDFSIAYGSYRRKHCKPCMASKRREIYSSDETIKKAMLANNKKSYNKNRDKNVAKMIEYRNQHLEEERQRSRDYRKQNPDRIRALSNAAKARKRNAFVEVVDPEVIWQRDKGVCGICNRLADREDFHIDHIRPLSKNGEHSYANTQVAHPFCNLSKGSKI